MLSKVFVYGSLMTGMHNHAIIKGSKLLGPAESFGKDFAMYAHSMDTFPLLIEGNERVVGELWEVDEDRLHRLDILEGHPHFYKRKERVFECRGIQVPAWIYIFQDSVRQARRINGNDWRAYKEAQTSSASAHSS